MTSLCKIPHFVPATRGIMTLDAELLSECFYGVCIVRYADVIMLSGIMLNVTMHSVVKLVGIMLSVIMLGVVKVVLC